MIPCLVTKILPCDGFCDGRVAARAGAGIGHSSKLISACLILLHSIWLADKKWLLSSVSIGWLLVSFMGRSIQSDLLGLFLIIFFGRLLDADRLVIYGAGNSVWSLRTLSMETILGHFFGNYFLTLFWDTFIGTLLLGHFFLGQSFGWLLDAGTLVSYTGRAISSDWPQV